MLIISHSAPSCVSGLSESITEFESSGELSCVNQETVEKLTEGLISHYLPDLKQLKNALQELTYVYESIYARVLINY